MSIKFNIMNQIEKKKHFLYYQIIKVKRKYKKIKLMKI